MKFSTVILLLLLIEEVLLSVTSESMCTEYWLNAESKLAHKSNKLNKLMNVSEYDSLKWFTVTPYTHTVDGMRIKFYAPSR